MKKIYEKDTAQTYGNAGYKHVMENFSFQSFSEKLDKSVSERNKKIFFFIASLYKAWSLKTELSNAFQTYALDLI